MRVQVPGYEVLVGSGLLGQLPDLVQRRCPAHRYAVVSDSHVGPLYGEKLVATLRDATLHAEMFAFPAGESNKTRETWADLSDRLLAAHFGRDSAVIALGGGVVGDVAGFVAATYLRGIPYVQVPTTLLAMIDSSVGGKTGVDLPAGKNLVGAFHQPRLVLVDLDLLASLPPAQFSAGLAEAVKHGVIADAGYFELLEREHAAILGRDAGLLEQVVRRSVEIKAAVVAEDEREAGRRAILNFGHTVGHAIEATSRYEILHGEAVAIGMVVEARLGESLGVTEPGTAARVAKLLERFRLPVEPPSGATADELIAVMRGDKKVRGGEIRFALPLSPSPFGRGRTHVKDTWTVGVEEERIREVLL